MGVYEVIQDVEENHVVTHENDRAWRNAVVMNKPSLLALRWVNRLPSLIGGGEVMLDSVDMQTQCVHVHPCL